MLMREEYDIKNLNPRKNPYSGRLKETEKSNSEHKGAEDNQQKLQNNTVN